MKLYVQCRLRRGETFTIGWVETRGARVGCSVELLPERELWEIVGVADVPKLREDQLREMQQLNRKSLSSIEAMT